MTQAVLVAPTVELNEGWPALCDARGVPPLHIFVKIWSAVSKCVSMTILKVMFEVDSMFGNKSKMKLPTLTSRIFRQIVWCLAEAVRSALHSKLLNSMTVSAVGRQLLAMARGSVRC